MQSIIRNSIIIFIGCISLFLQTNISFAECGPFTFWGPCQIEPPYCQWDSCNPDSTRPVLKAQLWWLSDKPITVYAQDIVKYLLSFVSLVAVFYIIYAGFQVMTGAWDEEKMKKAKNVILYVVIGIIIMWLAYGIVRWTLKLL